jgi:hypothetical protein
MHVTAATWALTIAVALAGPNDPVPAARSCRRIMVIVPRDAWRLSVETNGSARINFAALPQTAEVRVGTFRFRRLHSELARRATPTEKRERAGTVEFTDARSGRKVLRYLSDEGYATDLFERAWAHVVTDPDEVGREHVEMLRAMWNRRDGPRRQ